MATVEESIGRILHALATRPESEYWYGLADERAVLLAHVDEALAALTPRLADPSAKARRYLARLVRNLHRSRAATILFPLLEDPDDEVRLEACGAVMREAPLHPDRIAEPPPTIDPGPRVAVIAAARTFLEGRLPYAVPDALRWLEHLGDRELPDLLVGLVSAPRCPQRSELCAALARAADGGERLAGLARHPEADVRARACSGIAHALSIDRALVVETIVIALDDADPGVRSAAMAAARRHAVHEAEESLLRLADAGALDAADALAALRSERGLPLLLLAAARGGAPAQLRAIAALASYPPRDAIEHALLRVFADTADIDVRATIVATLDVVGGPASIEAVAAFLLRDVRGLPKRQRKALIRTVTPTLARWRAHAALSARGR